MSNADYKETRIHRLYRRSENITLYEQILRENETQSKPWLKNE